MLTFTGKIKHKGYTYYIEVPASSDKMLQQKGYIPVKGTINNYDFIGSLAPRKPDKHILYLHRKIRKKAMLNLNDLIRVEIELDTSSREIAIPDDVELILRENEENWNTFLSLSESRRNEFLNYILEAKRAETRLKRIDFLITRLIEFRAK